MSDLRVQNESGPSGPLSRFLRLAEWVEETFIAYLLAAMTIIAFANVVVRRVFGGSLIWALELTLNLFLYLVLFGMAYVLRKGAHIGVDVIVNLFPRAAQRWINVVAGLISAFYAILFAWTGYLVTGKFLSSSFLRTVGSDELDIPHWFTYGFLTFGFAYLAITIFAATAEVLAGTRESITASHEAEDLVEEARKEGAA
jgi:C4-dicarboxylate transporter DctQ subunit